MITKSIIFTRFVTKFLVYRISLHSLFGNAYSPKNDAKYISNSHDYVVMYARSLNGFQIGRLPRTEEANARYNNPDNDPRGVWKPSDMSVQKPITPQVITPLLAVRRSGRSLQQDAVGVSRKMHFSRDSKIIGFSSAQTEIVYCKSNGF